MNNSVKTLILMFMLSYIGSASAIPDNLHFHGILVEEPCIIKPGDESVRLDFGNVPDKNLYAYGRTVSEAFTINLSECDTSVGKSVNVTFSGTANMALPGYLALQSSSNASGFAIGIEDADGTFLPVNTQGEKLALQNGTTALKFKAYLKGEPEAISKREIKRGPFNAIATFKLDYE
ncbi:type 1 fimbrial protein [Providencia stuartii]|uniref:Exotoxin n=3 Tax=Enterobacterales TaxID=91347 RepID=A0A1S1HUI2_PROST|nr:MULTISPECIES: fimbrial protein [Providencia]MDV5226108.1 fimbrial protein [Providencia rettgeri]ELR5112309.1 type 1 fimbrial protein [Providencia stuartii]ELR5302052.1 type 1 fimbrial protein [Providencia stuartii]MDW7590524.1 fimbrial protein [Providencia sp. 2023EL-00965]MDX4945848.1 fimbrial protein [Providencia manganoxydans]